MWDEVADKGALNRRGEVFPYWPTWLAGGAVGSAGESWAGWVVAGRPPRSTKAPVICQRIVPPTKNLTLFPAHIVRHYMEQGGMRTKTSPHARVRVEIGDDPAGELPALPQ